MDQKSKCKRENYKTQRKITVRVFDLGYATKTQITKGKKIGKLDFIKIENLCMSKNSIKKVKRHLTDLGGGNIHKSYT